MNSLRHPHPPRGAALVITLIFLVLISILVVGFTDTSRMERMASGNHLERRRATNLAQEGVENVVAILRRETTDKKRNWVSSPGKLIVPDDPATDPEQTRLMKAVPLSTGAPDSTAPTDSFFRPANLNVQTLVDQTLPTHVLTEQLDPDTGTTLTMRLRWVYVRADGQYEFDASGEPIQVPDTTNKANPIVGRFTYWTDDESSKVNYNLAWTRGAVNTNPPAHPTQISLLSLTGMTDALANDIHRFVTFPDGTVGNKIDYEKIANRFYNSPLDARAVSPAVAAVLRDNKFEATHYSHDPDTTFFNEPRIVLTTQKRWARGRPFLDILTNPGTDTTNGADPGSNGNLSQAKLAAVVKTLVNPRYGVAGYVNEKAGFLQRTDWPMVTGTGSSIQKKYFGTTADAVSQLTEFALCIIDYVRSAESAMTLVEPTRGIIDQAGSYGNKIPYAFVSDNLDPAIRGRDKTFKGLTRSLFATEMGVWVDSTKNAANRWPCKLFVEVHLPQYGGLDSLDLTSIDGKRLYLYFYETTASTASPAAYYAADGTTVLSGKWFKIDTANIVGGNPILEKGKYAKLSIPFFSTKTTRPTTMKMRLALIIANNTPSATPPDPGTQRLEVAPIGQPGNSPDALTLSYTIDAATVAEAAITSYSVDDPRANGVALDWTSGGQQTNSFGLPNPRNTLGTTPATATVPEQDTDGSAKLTDASHRIPYKKGDARNKDGLVLSPAELGYIHTGIEVNSRSGKTGVPWRTIRLQPNAQPNSVVPDWAFMDLFTVPANVPAAGEPMFAPHKTNTGGRININARAEPFALERILPLAAVFNGAPYDALDATKRISPENAAVIARNINDRTLATGGKSYGYAEAYDSPGEIVEVQGVADSGEASEELVRQIANLITPRGNVFSVYSVGQALKQTPNGKLVMTGEQRLHTMIERYLVGKGTTTTDDDEVAIRPVYVRNLTP